jgi:3-phenylpropionate/trans-cinnamate dioxygenase ferredoxin reductase subunit
MIGSLPGHLSRSQLPGKEGVVYYLRERRVPGVQLWNVFGQVDGARRLIASPGPFHSADLKGRLPG